MLMNSQFLLDQSARFARRLQSEAGDNPARQITLAWQLAFNRSPSAGELRDSLAFLQSQSQQFPSAAASANSKDAKTKVADTPSPGEQALTDLCQALFSANEFLYVD
jgi:hypothetical protein